MTYEAYKKKYSGAKKAAQNIGGSSKTTYQAGKQTSKDTEEEKKNTKELTAYEKYKQKGSSKASGKESGKDEKGLTSYEEYKNRNKKTDTSFASTGSELLSAFQEDYSKWATALEEDSKTIGYGNASQKRETALKSAGNLRSRAYELLTSFEDNRDLFDEETYNSVSDYLKNVRSSLDQSMSFYDSHVKLAEESKDEAEYDQTVRFSGYHNKYNGMGRNEINAILSNMDSGSEEYQWLKAYYDTEVYTEQDALDQLAYWEKQKQNLYTDPEVYQNTLAPYTGRGEIDPETGDERKHSKAYMELIGDDGEQLVEHFYDLYNPESAEANERITELNPDAYTLLKVPEVFKDGFDWYDIPLAVAGTAGDLVLDAAKGFAGLAEGAVDLATLGVAEGADLFGADGFAEGARDFAKTGLVDEATRDVDTFLEKASIAGGVIDNVAQGTGQVAGLYLTGGLAAAGGLGKLGTGALTYSLLGTSSMGSATVEALNAGASKGDAFLYGLISGAGEVAAEMLFGGVGKGLNVVGFSKSSMGIDDWTAEMVSKVFKTTAGKNTAQVFVKSGFEGVEDLLSTALQTWGKSITYADESFWELIKDENLLEQYLTSVFTSALTQSGYVPGMPGANQYTAEGRDFVSGLTAGEQTAVDQLYAKQIELQGADLSRAQKTQIYDGLVADVQQGLIDPEKVSETNVDAVLTQYQDVKSNMQQVQTGLTEALVEKGVSKKTAQNIAEVYAKASAGVSLNKTEYGLFESVTKDKNLSETVEGYFKAAASSEKGDAVTAEATEEGVFTEGVERAFSPEGAYSVASKGKAIRKDTGANVDVKGVSAVSKGNMVLELSDGSTVNAKDVDFANESDALIYEAVAKLGDNINAETANKLISQYKGGDAMVFARGMTQAYTYGFYGIDRSELMGEHSLATELTREQRDAAYDLGKKYRPQKDMQDRANAQLKKTPGEKGVYFRDKDGTVTDISTYLRESGTVLERDVQKTAIEAMRKLSEVMGTRFVVFESFEENGKRYFINEKGEKEIAPNGYYSTDTGEIYIDIHAGNKGEGLMLFTIAHELTHFMRAWSPEHFRKISEIVFHSSGMKGDVTRLVALKQEQLKANKRKHDYDTAIEEVVADSMETILRDGKVFEFMQEVKRQDYSSWQKLKNWFKNLAKFLRKMVWAYHDISAQTEEGQRIAAFSQDLLNQIEMIWAEGAMTAGENYQGSADGYKAEQEQFSTANIRGNADGAVAQSEAAEALTTAPEGGILESTRTEYEALPKQMMNLSDGAGTILDFIEGLTATKVKGLGGKSINGYTGRDVRGYAMGISGFTKAQIQQVNKFMDTMADFMEEAGVTYKFIGLQDVENAKLHYTYNADGSIKSIVLSAMVKNGDYPVNFDLSSICKKRVAMSRLIDKLARRGTLDNGTVKLTPANIFKINTALKNAGYETACLGCFVESKRYNSLEWAKTFCNKWNAAVKKVNPNATYFGYGDASFTEESFTLDQAIKIDEAATKYTTATKTERLQNAMAKYRVKEQEGKPLVESFSKAALKRLASSETISDELKAKYLNSDPTTLNIADVEFLLENGILPGAALSNKQAVTEMVKSGEVYQHLLRPSDLLTDRGISKLEALPNFHGVLYGHYGSGTPKLMQSYTPYNSEIALLPSKKGDLSLAEYLYSIAGVRMQSFSDFQIQNIYDYLQMVGDLAARKIPAHAYTKEISFAKLLGMTGIKVNLSVMFDIDPMVDKAHAGLTKLNKLVHRGEYAGVVLEDEQGKWVYNIGDYQTQKLFAEAFPDEAKRFLQSIGFGDAVKLQTTPGYSANCGIIGVGYSDLGIFAMLNDHRIRYIIPYHASSLPAEIKVATNIALGTDYTPYQNNMKIKEIADRNGNKVNWTIKEAYKRLGSGQAVINELNEKIRTEGWVVSTSKAQTGHGTYGLYENLQETNDPRQTASNFMDWCIGNGTLPLFYQFASHENYYKLLYDFNVYDCVTEEYAPQQAVTNTYPTMVDGQVQPGNVTDGGFDAEYLKGTIDKQMAFMDAYGRSLDEDLDTLAENMEEGNYSLRGEDNTSDLDSDIKRSDRTEDSVSNRSLLANALEGAAQNDIERNKIREYKDKIDLIEAEEQKLGELNEKIKELSFSKGPRDKEGIRKLRDEAIKTANRINTYDKQLLRLEASKPLQDLLEREKSKAYKRAAEKGREVLKEQRESVHRSQIRTKIRNVVGELNRLLLHEDKKHHVPDSLKKVVAESLAMLNTDNTNAETRAEFHKSRLEKLYAQLDAAEGDQDLQMSIQTEIDEAESLLAKYTKTANRLKELRDAYAEIENSSDPDIQNGYDPVIANAIEGFVADIGDTPLKDLRIEQLSDIYDMYKMILTRVRDANKSLIDSIKDGIKERGSKVIEQVRKVGGEHTLRASILDPVKKFFWNNLKPVYAFERIGSKVLQDAFDQVRKGEDTWAEDIIDAKAYFREKAKKHGYDNWDFDKKYSFTSITGVDFELSLEQIMALYAYSKRNQADEHLRIGGFVFDSNIESREEKVKEKNGKKKVKKSILKYKVNTATTHQISKETIAQMVSVMEKEASGAKAFVDEMQDYLSTVMGAKGNEVTMKMYGVKLFKEKFYFPLKSAKQFLFEKNEVAGEIRIKNSGFTNKTKPNASNPIILNNFMDVWADHVNEMSMYHAFVLPLEDFNRIFNYQTQRQEGQNPVSVKSALQNAYGPEAANYISQLITDLNGGAVADPRETLGKALTAKFKKAKVFSSLSVVIQQPSAIGRAFAEISPKYFLPTKDGMGHDALWTELKKYAPVAVIKEMGYFDTNMGRSTRDFIKAQEYSGFKEKAKALFADSGYRDEALSRLPALADEVTWCAIWNAVKRETVATHKELRPGSEEFLKAAGERFTEVVTRTQVYDSVLARSANMRSKSGLMSMITSFMAEPTTAINMVENAVLKAKRGQKGYAGKAFAAVGVSILLNNALVALVYAMRDDDEDETFLEKYLSSFVGNMLDDINPVTYYPYLKDAWSLLQGYDIERADMSLVSDFVSAAEGIVKAYTSENGDVVGAWHDLAFAFTNLGGIPLQNIRRDLNGANNFVQTLIKDFGGRKTTWGSLGNALLDTVKGSTPVWGWFPDDKKSDKIYDAIIDGDKAYVNRLKSGYKDEDAYRSAVRTGLRANDPRIKEAALAQINGDPSERVRIQKLIIADGFDQNDVVAATISQINAMTSNASSTGAKKAKGFYTAEDFALEIVSGDQASAKSVKADIIQTAQKNGKSAEEAEKSFASSARSELKELFLDGEISEQDAIKALTVYCGDDREDAVGRVREWEFESDHGFAYGDLKQSFIDGTVSAAKVKSALMTTGGKTKEEAESRIVDYCKEAYESGEFTKTKAVNTMVSDGGLSKSEAESKVQYIDVKKRFPDTYVDDAWVDEYYSEVESSGVSIEVFVYYRTKVKGITGEGKKERRMTVIDSLPISDAQKDALYYAEGWASSKLYEAPWH